MTIESVAPPVDYFTFVMPGLEPDIHSCRKTLTCYFVSEMRALRSIWLSWNMFTESP